MKRRILAMLIFAACVALWLITPAHAGCLNTAEADASPAALVKVSPGKWHYNYNVQAFEVDRDGDGQAETIYRYCYGVMHGAPGRGKIQALIEQNKTGAVDTVEADRTDAADKLADIAQMSYAQVETYVENTWGNLPAAQKTALKNLYKAVLAIIKMQDLQ